MKNKIELVTMKDVTDFINAVSNIDSEVYLTDPRHKFKVSAKSQLAAALAMAEWDNIFVECEKDIYQTIKKWIR